MISSEITSVASTENASLQLIKGLRLSELLNFIFFNGFFLYLMIRREWSDRQHAENHLKLIDFLISILHSSEVQEGSF